MTSIVKCVADVNGKIGVLPRYVAGGKYYSLSASTYIRNTTLKTVDGKTTKDAIAALGLDSICQSQQRNGDEDISSGDNWNAIKELAFYNADINGAGLSPHFIIGTADSYNSGYTTAPSRGGGKPSPEESGVDASGIGNHWSPEYLYSNCLVPYLAHINNDLSRIVSIELCNEPETMTLAQLGLVTAWYRTDGTANLRFIVNQSRRYANYFESQMPGLRSKVFSGSLSIGALSGETFHLSGGVWSVNDNPVSHQDRMINGYTDFGGWRWGTPAGTKNDPNTNYFGISVHGYFIPSAGLAGGAGGNWQDILNLMLYAGSDYANLITLPGGQYQMPKGNFIPANNQWRAMMDAAGGQAAKLAWTEMWPWSGQDALMPLMDAGQFVAALQNWNTWNGCVYFFAGLNVSPGQSPSGFPQTSDSLMSDFGGHILRTPRWYFLRDFATMFNGARSAPKNVCPVTVTTRKTTPASYDNAIDTIWAFQTMSDDNTKGRYFIFCGDAANQESVLVKFVDKLGIPRTALSVTAYILEKTLPIDTDPAAWWLTQHGVPFAPVPQNSGDTGGTNDSVLFTMPAPSVVRLDITFSGGSTPPPLIPNLVNKGRKIRNNRIKASLVG